VYATEVNNLTVLVNAQSMACQHRHAWLSSLLPMSVMRLICVTFQIK